MKVIFWDWNGTIANDASLTCDVFNDLIERLGCSRVTLERYREIYRHPLQRMYEDVGVDFTRHPFELIANEWHQEYCSRLPSVGLHHDALPAFEALSQRGSRQMVLSALPQRLLDQSIQNHKIAHFFEKVVGLSDDLGHGKVGEAIKLVEFLGIRGSDITVIGDSSHDAEVAREISANCFLVARGAESRSRLEAHGYPVFETFNQFLALAE